MRAVSACAARRAAAPRAPPPRILGAGCDEAPGEARKNCAALVAPPQVVAAAKGGERALLDTHVFRTFAARVPMVGRLSDKDGRLTGDYCSRANAIIARQRLEFNADLTFLNSAEPRVHDPTLRKGNGGGKGEGKGKGTGLG